MSDTPKEEPVSRPPGRRFVMALVAGVIVTIVVLGGALLLGAIFFVERSEPQRPYPPELVADFTETCMAEGSPRSECECLIGELEETVPVEQLFDAEAGHLDESISVHLRDVQDECR